MIRVGFFNTGSYIITENKYFQHEMVFRFIVNSEVEILLVYYKELSMKDCKRQMVRVCSLIMTTKYIF